jgi:hypothetical protein
VLLIYEVWSTAAPIAVPSPHQLHGELK